MKLHIKISVLLFAFTAVLIMSFIALHYINHSVQDVFLRENRRNQSKIIDNVIAIKTSAHQQLIDDNSSWDDLVDFTEEPDSVWAIANIDFMVSIFNHATVMVFDKSRELIHQFSASSLTSEVVPPDSATLDFIFSQSPFCHYFEYSGDHLIEYCGAIVVPSVDATDRQTKPQGFLISGEEWNDHYLNNLYESTGFEPQLYKIAEADSIVFDKDRDYIVQELHNAYGTPIAKVVFSRISPFERDLKNFLYLTVLIAVLAGFALIAFLFYFRRVLMEPFNLINRTLQTDDERYIRRLSSKTPEFTELKALILKFFEQQGELKSNNSRLIELNSTKDKLFSIIGHDLRNPVGNIRAASGIIAESIKNKETENAELLAELVEKESGEALNLLETLLDWAKTQTGTLQYSPKTVRVREITDRVTTYLSASARLKEIKIDTNAVEDLEVVADFNMLTTILRNLISNAIKFTNPGGRIRVAISKTGKQITFAVEDNGIGMNEKTISRLFNTATNNSTYGTANEKGTGLGLIICKEFIEKHGGTIRVESEIGNGSRFLFHIFG